MRIDRASLEELMQNADIEGFLAGGSPADEYDLEVDDVLARLHALHSATESEIVSVVGAVWQKAFSLTPDQLSARQPAFEGLARTILHFFPGPA